MRPAPAPASSQAEPLVERPKTRASLAKTRKARARRVALESLEPRALMAVLPLSPLKDPQILIDKTGFDNGRVLPDPTNFNNPGNASSPQIVVNRYDPAKIVAVWTDHDVRGGPEPEYVVRGAYSTNYGTTWTALPGLPNVRFDPSSDPNNPHPYDRVSRPTVAWDGADNFYVLEIQQSADIVTAGDVILKPYSFSGAAPVGGPEVTIWQWDRTAEVPIVKAIRDASLAVDDNLASYTDPITGQTLTNAGANRVYIAWETDEPVPTGFTPAAFWNFNTVELLTSTNNGQTFSAPITNIGAVHPNGRSDYRSAAAPRLTVTQGRAPGTLSANDAGVVGGQITVVFDDFNSAGNLDNAPTAVDVIRAATFTPNASGTVAGTVSTVGFTVVRGARNSPYPLASPSTPIGIGPAPAIASDNTLGNFAHPGRAYVAYVDRYDTARFSGAGNNPADNTEIFLAFNDFDGKGWQSAGQVNDDAALRDGFSSAVVSPGLKTGRPQYLPAIAVDPATGTVAVSYQDTRFDPSLTRTVDSIQLSGDGGATWSASTHADADLIAYDQTTQRDQVIGPVGSNQALKPDVPPGAGGLGGLGDRQGLALYDGRLYAAFATNMNGGSDTGRITQIHVSPMLYQTGPRVVSSTMGLVGAQTVTDRGTGTAITFNGQETSDGTPIVEGFVITFDRAVDIATFGSGDITVTYRDGLTAGSSPGIPVPIISNPIPLADGVTPASVNGTTKFLVRFAPQSFVGTYSYAVGPNLRDLSRGTQATNYYYADQSAANITAVPPFFSGGTGVPANDNATSTVVIQNVPVSQGILDLDVLISLQHSRLSDLTIKLIPPPGYLPAGGPQFILLGQGMNGSGLSDTIFDDQSARALAAGTGPYTGHFRVATGSLGLAAIKGRSPNGTWTLQIEDNVNGQAGALLSWGLKATTSTRTFDGKFNIQGAALSPNVGGPIGVISGGHLMDQDADGIGGRNPNAGGSGPAGTLLVGLSPGDIYAAPRPNPIDPQIFNGLNINPPFDTATLPLMISGPHVVRSFVPGYTTKTPDNLVTDRAVTGFNIVFDRDMDPASITVGTHVARVTTPYGTFTPARLLGDGTYDSGDILPDGSRIVTQIVADPNSDPNQPGIDTDPTHPRTYRVTFQKLTIDPTTGAQVLSSFPQVLSGTYSVTLTSDVQSANGDRLDTNQNAGLDVLRDTPSAGTVPQMYDSQAPVPLNTGPSGTTYISTINVPDGFLVKNVVVELDIDYPEDRLLTAELVAPDGFAVTLFSGVGAVGNGMNFSNTVLDDAATTPIANGGPPFFGTFNPMQPLAQFRDHFSQGNWSLRVTVNGVPSVSGTSQIRHWGLTLAQPLSNSGLGEAVADQVTQSFRIFTFDPTNQLASNTWTAIGPNGLGAKERGGNAEVAGRVGAVALDPSDPSGNTAYVAGASGGIWKTTNFLTKDASGPIYTPLIDDASNFGLNIGSIAVFPRNNDPNQSIIFAATGDASAAGDPAVRGLAGTQRGVGFLRSMDGGRTWTLLDSRNNDAKDHFFASIAGQPGVTSYKIVVDPKPTPNGDAIVYAALADIDANGNLVANGPKGGLWKSIDSGKTWVLMRGGQVTDVTLDLKSTNANSGNLDILYAAFRGDGVYFSPNGGQNLDLMTGTVGNPLIQSVDTGQPQPTSVAIADTPNGKPGRIVLAKPALTGNDLSDRIYQGWLYAAVVQQGAGDIVENGSSAIIGVYMTKDFGQNWVPVRFSALGGSEIPTNDTSNGNARISGSGTKVGAPFTLGNFALSLAVDANNANIVYLGGTNEYRPTGLIRIDTTLIHDAHSFFLDDNNQAGGLHSAVPSGVALRDPTAPLPPGTPPYEPRLNPFVNLIRDPSDPFRSDATILVQNVPSVGGAIAFLNDGAGTKWTRFDRAITPDPYASASDPWSQPTRDVHQILTVIDPLTGGTRFVFATDQGVYTAVAGKDGQLIGSIGDTATTNSVAGNQEIVNGSRNGNLAIAQVYQGASQPSQLAADVALLRGFFYGTTQDVGIFQSDPDILKKGSAGYGNLSANVDSVNGGNQWTIGNGGTIDRGTGGGLATQQTFKVGDAGTLYAYRVSEDSVGIDGGYGSPTPAYNAVSSPAPAGRPSTDTVRVNTVGKTFRLYQTANPGNTPDAQWQFRQGYNLTVNPLSGDQMLISSQAGRVFATTDRGNLWSEIGNPGALDGTEAQALTYGAPDPAASGGGLGSLNNYIFAGTVGGRIFVTFTGGGGSGNTWTPLSAGLDGSPVQMIVTNPTRGSHEAYAITQRGVYHMVDAKAGGSWIPVTGNLFSVVHGQFGDATLGTQQAIAKLTAIQADWRYLIPDNFANPTGPTHPMLYVSGEGGVVRSYDGGANWTLFPDGTVNADGTPNTSALLNSPLGSGGGLPSAIVTDLDLSLGNVDPTTGRPDIATGPNLLQASTYGRGSFAIRLAPIVFPNTSGNSAILHLSTTAPVPPGTSDSGFINTDAVTNSTMPVIEGLSEQTAFGNTVRVALFDVSDTTVFTQDAINAILAGLPNLPDGSPTPQPIQIPVERNTDKTDSTGRFAVQVAAGYFKAFDPANPSAIPSDGAKRILVQAVNGSGTKGNFAPLGKLLTSNFATTGAAQLVDPTAYSFILDTTPPVATGTPPAPNSPPGTPSVFPGAPDLDDSSDAGLVSTDNITNVTTGLKFRAALPSGEPATTRVYLVRDNDSNVVDEKFGVAGTGAITLTDPGPVSDGAHFYYTYEVDLAGNKGPNSPQIKVTIDTTPPARPNPPILDATNPTGGSDSGIVGDNITNVKRPFLAGSAEAGGLVQIIDAAGNVLGPAGLAINVDPTNGRYSVAPSGPLADGTYTLRVQELDLAGNKSQASAPITITILSRTPSKPTLFLVPADDSGTVGDNITNVSQPRLIGSSTAGLSVKLILDSGTVKDANGNVVPIGGTITPLPSQAPVIVAADGTFVLKFPSKLADDTYTFHVEVSDVAGNKNVSDTLTIQILGGDGGTGGGGGSQKPDAPTLALNPADDSGIKGDNTTSVRRPRFTGVAKYTDGSVASGVAVDLVNTANGAVLAITTTTTTGAFTISLPNDLVNGKISVQARVRDVAGNPGPGSNIVNLSVISVAGDADNDGKADLESFSRVTSQFTFTSTGTGVATGSAPFLTAAGDVPFQADFDGDGKTDYGFYRPSTAQWFVRQSRAGNALVPFGVANQTLPVPADFDGDGRSDFATFNQNTGLWTIFQSSSGTLRTASFGVPGLDQPVPADFDGDGKADFVVYRPSTSQWLASFSSGKNAPAANNAFSPPNSVAPVPNTAFGQPNIDVPIVADYDGDGKADVAVYRTTTSQWFINYSQPKAGTAPGVLNLQGLAFGNVGTDIPVPADYDGDGKDDFALFRSTNANWLILGSSTPGKILVSGSANNVPLVAPLQPYRYKKAGLVTKAVLGSQGADFEAIAPIITGPADMGKTAAGFGAGKTSAAKPTVPASTPIRRPAQAGQPTIIARFGNPNQPITGKRAKLKLNRRKDA